MRQNKRDEIIRKALDIFYRDGFHATGMDKLVAETRISKTSMYKHFRTKEEMILAVLQLRDENFRTWLYGRIADMADTPRDQMLAMFDALEEWFALPEFRGCMFVKASAEYQEKDDPIHIQSVEHKRLLLEHFKALADAAGANNPEVLACQLMLLKEGAIITAVLANNCGPAKDAKSAAVILIQHAIPENAYA